MITVRTIIISEEKKKNQVKSDPKPNPTSKTLIREGKGSRNGWQESWLSTFTQCTEIIYKYLIVMIRATVECKRY